MRMSRPESGPRWVGGMPRSAFIARAAQRPEYGYQTFIVENQQYSVRHCTYTIPDVSEGIQGSYTPGAELGGATLRAYRPKKQNVDRRRPNRISNKNSGKIRPNRISNKKIEHSPAHR